MSYADDLLKLIISDKEKSGTYDRYPIRFLFTRLYNNTFKDISDFYNKYITYANSKDSLLNDLEIIKLSSLLSFNDAWITKQKLYDMINNLDPQKDYLILGFSELARFYSKLDLQSLILSFMTDIESIIKNSKQRIYLVCFSLFEKLEEVLKINGRNANINPIIKHPNFVDNDSICVYYANSSFDIDALDCNIINNTSDWLSLFESSKIDFCKGIVCLSDTLVSIYEKAKPDNFVEIYKIDSYFSLLVRMHGMNISESYEFKFDNCFWKEVYDLSVDYGTNAIKTITTKFLETHSISSDNFIELFIKTDDFGKKLLILYLDDNADDIKYSHYLSYILDKSAENGFKTVIYDIVTKFDNLFSDYDFLARKFFIDKLFEIKMIDRNFNQEALLKTINTCFNTYLSTKIYTSKLENEDLTSVSLALFKEKYSQEPTYMKKVFEDFYNEFVKKSFTGKFKVEQYILMNYLSEELVPVNEINVIYEDLDNYLGKQFSEYLNSSKYWISDYIYEYRKSKILNKATDKFESLSLKNTEEFMYNWYLNSSLEHQQDLIDKNTFDKLIVFDGVGIEYFDYLINCLREKGKFINYADYAKCYLPSITDINKSKIIKYDKWVLDFDKERIHGNIYNSKQSIPDSLDFLRKMIDKVIDDNPASTICITADHGCTCQSKLIDSNKKYSFKGTNHEGRCMEISSGEEMNIPKSDDYFIFEDIVQSKKYLISLNNTSLDSKPIREAHGGATIEECFVPCIVFSNDNHSIIYNIKIIKDTVNGLDKEIKVEISPKPHTIPSFIDENGMQGLFKEEKDNIWSTTIFKVASQNIKILIDDYKCDLFIKSSSGISMKGEDGFDD